MLRLETAALGSPGPVRTGPQSSTVSDDPADVEVAKLRDQFLDLLRSLPFVDIQADREKNGYRPPREPGNPG